MNAVYNPAPSLVGAGGAGGGGFLGKELQVDPRLTLG
jgi:hypothetical protein